MNETTKLISVKLRTIESFNCLVDETFNKLINFSFKLIRYFQLLSDMNMENNMKFKQIKNI